MTFIHHPLVDQAPGEAPPAATEESNIPLPSTDPFADVDVNDPFVQQMLESLDRTHAVPTDTPPETGPTSEAEGTPGTEGEVAPPEPAPTPPEDAPPSLIRIGDVDYTPEQVTKAINIANWANRLNPTQAQFVDDVLLGRINPYQPQPAAVAPPTAPAEPEEDYIDPRAAAEIARINAELAQLKQSSFNVQQMEAERARADWMASVDRGVEAYAKRMNLNTQEVQSLSQITADMGIVPALAAKYQGQDQALAIQEAMDIAYWRTPEFRTRSIDAVVQTKVDEQQSELEALRARKQRAGTASGSTGGSAPRVAAVPDVKALSPREREAAIAGDIRKAMGIEVNTEVN